MAAFGKMVTLAKNLVLVEAPAREARLACCHACAEYRADTDQCRACGCLVRFKAVPKITDCPRGKWAVAAEEQR